MAPWHADVLLVALAALVAWRCARRGLVLDLLCTGASVLLALASWAVVWAWATSSVSTDSAALTLVTTWLAGAPLLRYAAGRIRGRIALAPAALARDHAWGRASGGAKGLLVLVLGSVLLDAADAFAAARPPADARAIAPTPADDAAEPAGTLDPGTRHALGRLGSVFGDLLYPSRTQTQLRALRTVLGADADELAGQPEVARILAVASRPTVAAALDDPELRDEIERLGRGSPDALVAIGRSAKIRAMLDDPDVKALVGSIDLVALAQGIEAARGSGEGSAGGR